MARRLIAVMMLLAAAGCRHSSTEALAASRIPLTDCVVPGVEGAARCGTRQVWENRAARSGRRIELHLVILPATGSPRADDPVFYFQGGPGGSAIDAAADIARLLRSVNEHRDLVFVDVRGTGRSHPLRCSPPPDDAPAQRYFDDFLSDDFVRSCSARQEADLRFYTQPIAMDDVDEVRAALGYGMINLFGSSGGTRQEQLYMRRHAGSVRSVVMQGVQPMDAEMPLPFSRAMEAGIRALLDSCAKDAACSADYPNLADDWEESKRRFESAPVVATVEHPHSRKPERVRIARGVFADGVRHMLYHSASRRELPRVVHAAARGNFDEFARYELRQAIIYGRALSYGMFISSTCAEDVRFITEEDIRRTTAGTFLGDYRVRRQQAACRLWPQGEGIDAGFQQPVQTDVPVLILSGDADVATPASDGERVARALPNAKHVVFPNQGHEFVDRLCASQLIADFIAAGSLERLDVSCVQTASSRPFIR